MRRALNLSTGFLSILLAAAVLLAGCGGSGEDQDPLLPPVSELRSTQQRATAPVVNSGDAATFANDNLAFSIDLYHQLRSANAGNFVYSQTSISTALAMLYAGARTTTAEQMADALHFSLPADRLHAAFNQLDLALTTPPPNANPAAFRLAVANSIWIQHGFTVLPTYLDTLAVNYGAGLFVEDFIAAPEPARIAINGWVANQTEDQITNLLPQGSITTLTRLVLANAVFFHGDWKSPFRTQLTQNDIFHALTGDVSVPTMRGLGNAAIWNGPGWNAAALDYVGDTASTIIVVPDAGTFSGFEASLTPQLLSTIFAGARPSGGADLIMPKFRFSTDVPLNPTLSALGMPVAFTDQADFSGINGARNLSVQSVVHQAIIAVDEKGTTAAAATAIVVGPTSVPPSLWVNRPFLFFVRHNPTGAILFQGRVVDPSR